MCCMSWVGVETSELPTLRKFPKTTPVRTQEDLVMRSKITCEYRQLYNHTLLSFTSGMSAVLKNSVH